MAVVKVVKPVVGWNVGDEVEADGARLKELVDDGLVVVVKDDTVPVVEEEVEEVIKEVQPRKRAVKRGWN